MSKGSTPLQDIQTLTNAELVERYGIRFEEDASIFDTVEAMWFNDLKEWAIYIEDQDMLYGESTIQPLYKAPSSREYDGYY
jgi:hypothetical protein